MWVICIPTVLLLLLTTTAHSATRSLVINNNHELPYTGAITFRADIPDGLYEGERGTARAHNGVVRAFVDLPAHSQVKMTKTASLEHSRPRAVTVQTDNSTLSILRNGSTVAQIDFGLVMVPGRSTTTDHVPSVYHPLPLKFSSDKDGNLSATIESSGYRVSIQAIPYPNSVDFRAEITRTHSTDDPAYLALVRRVITPDAKNHRMRWNGRILDSDREPDEYNIDFRLTRGLDWASWDVRGLRVGVINGFSPGITIERSPRTWITANRFYVWEYLRRQGNTHYLISEIAGRDPEQPANYRGVKSYTQPGKNETVKLKWRFAVADPAPANWEESQLRIFAGYRRISTSSNGDVVVDLGAPYVEFGTSYFPYSSMCENFDYFRTPGLDREGWWPFSPDMWERWREFAPQMQTDLRIIKSMGFDWVRLHHLELIGSMERKNALEFLDFYMEQCRTLGLKVLVDTAGSPEWFATIARRYHDVVKLIEIENEILIPGIKPGAPERWTACYNAVKKEAPEIEVFLTGNCNMAMFERLRSLSVPFDRTGYHSYKHGPGWEDTFKTLPLAVADCAAELGTTPVLGEFNWKELTRWSPEARAERFETIYRNVLSQRAVREFFQFHWQETLCVNPRLTRKGIRHYETIYLDRRPKPEARVLMKLIREYCKPDHPVREVPITIEETRFADGKASATVVVHNNTSRTLNVTLTPECFADVECKLASDNTLKLSPGEKFQIEIDLRLKRPNVAGVYHYFVRADYENKSSYGWGIVSNTGAPRFNPEPVLPDLVDYPQGLTGILDFDWDRPVCVAFGPDASILELEMAYLIFNTLQSATGIKMRLCATTDIPAELLNDGSLILVGTPGSNPLIGKTVSDTGTKGQVTVHSTERGNKWLLITGKDERCVQAAATDFVLRYWQNAKDSAIRITGMEPGAALGNPVAAGEVNPP